MSNIPRHATGVFVMILTAVVIAALFYVEIPDGNRETALVVLGVVMGWAGAVVTFHYGSSDGSKTKDVMLATRPSGEQDDPVHVEQDDV